MLGESADQGAAILGMALQTCRGSIQGIHLGRSEMRIVAILATEFSTPRPITLTENHRVVMLSKGDFASGLI